MLNRVLSVALFLAAARAADAQNFIQNSTFDSDSSPWTTSAFSFWSNAENHTESGELGGSLEASALDVESASQCVSVGNNKTYVLQWWVKNSPTREFRPCSSPQWSVQVAWTGDSICTEAPISVDERRSDTPLPTGWYENVMVPTLPNGANGAIVTLQSTCATHDGMSTFFFDDVSFMLDTVFRNDFEVHAHEGGSGGG